MRQILDVQSACGHVGGHEQLQAVLTELLHRQVALGLREVAVERVGVVAVAYEKVGHLLRLEARAAEDDGVDFRIVVDEAFQGEILVFGMHQVVDVVDVLGPLVARAYDNFLVVVQIVFGDALDVFAHGGREEERIALFGHARQDGVDAVGEAHVEHFVGFVEHDVLHGVELGHAALHEVDEAPGGGHDDLGTLAQGAYLALDARAAVDGQYVQPVDVSRIVFQVAGDLQAELACGAQDDGLRAAVGGVDLLEHGQAIGGRLARARLGQGDDVVARAQEVGNHFFLHGHGVFVAHFADGAADFFRDAKFFKRFQISIRGIKGCDTLYIYACVRGSGRQRASASASGRGAGRKSCTSLPKAMSSRTTLDEMLE